MTPYVVDRAEQHALLVDQFQGCEARQGWQREMTAMAAQDLVDLGILTLDQALDLCPYAYTDEKMETTCNGR